MNRQNGKRRMSLFGGLLKMSVRPETARPLRAAIARERWRSAAGLVFLLALAVTPLRAQEGRPPALPDGEGKELLATACSQCHALRPVLMLRYGREGWKDMVQEMVMRGAQLRPAEADTVVRYLSTHFGPGRNILQTGPLPSDTALGESAATKTVKEVSLPNGPGRQETVSRCGVCHDLGRVVSARRSQADWEAVVREMLALGPPATPEQTRSIIQYLSSQFGLDGK